MSGVSNCFNRDGKSSELLFMRRVCGYCTEQDSRPLSFEKGLPWAKIRQPNKKIPILEEIAKGVTDLLRTEPQEIKFFTTVCSPLDFHHDISAFFEFKNVVVTVCATMNPHKKNVGRYVDFLIDDGTDIPLSDTIKNIAYKLRQKLNRQERERKGISRRIAPTP